MKVAVLVLLVAVGVCSAAFSPSLVQQTRPLLEQARLHASYATRSLARRDNKALAGFAESLIQSVVAQAEEVLEEIQASLASVEARLFGLPAFIIAQLQALLERLLQAAQSATGGALQLIIDQIEQIQILLAGGKSEEDRVSSVILGPLLALLEQLRKAAETATGAALELIQQQIAQILEIIGGGKSIDARELVAKLDIGVLLQGALGQLAEGPLIPHLIAQLLPFLEDSEVGPLVAQIIAVLQGVGQLDHSAPRGISDLVEQLRLIVQAIHASLGQGLAQAQVIAQALIAQAIATGQANAIAAVQHIVAQIQTLPAPLNQLAQPLLQALQSLGQSLGQSLSKSLGQAGAVAY